MHYQNNSSKVRLEILIRVAKSFKSGTLRESVDKIAYEMIPASGTSLRCCIYKSRAVIRSRCIAALGFALENEEDDSTLLQVYAEEALSRPKPEAPVMTVLRIACHGCVNNRYYVTDVCQNCMARPCAVNCPVDAISFKEGRACIDGETCIDCGKCKMVCPYNAITRVSVPCEQACPVDAIHKDKSNHAEIDFDKCISCGRCMRSCPFGAVMDRSQMIDVLRAIESDKKVVALYAPAIAGQFPGSLEQISQALLELGFDDYLEVAHGADKTTTLEAAEFQERILEEGQPFMTTSCCPAYIETTQRHLPEIQKYVSDTKTPMHYAAEQVKSEDPETITVFIGPCVAKRKEGFDDPYVDYVLTFEEAGALLVAEKIEVGELEEAQARNVASRQARGFAVTNGVASAVASVLDEGAEIKPLCINGLNLKAIKKLQHYATKGDAGAYNLIEVMACEGGCVAGAGVVATPKLGALAVKRASENGRQRDK